jgi:hypothetical protein
MSGKSVSAKAPAKAEEPPSLHSPPIIGIDQFYQTKLYLTKVSAGYEGFDTIMFCSDAAAAAKLAELT